MNPEEEIIERKERLLTNGLRKADRLSSRTMVTRLFEAGKSRSAYPLRCVSLAWSLKELQGAFRAFDGARVGRLQVMVTVPKKKRRHAVDRVLMRRRIREAWRQNRHGLEEALRCRDDIFSLSVALVYMADRNHSYAKVESRLKSLLERLTAEINGENDA